VSGFRCQVSGVRREAYEDERKLDLNEGKRQIGRDMDDWGKDPAVQGMRRVFKGMETSLAEILGRLAISPYDLRIRGWLEKALAKFEQSWGVAHQMGISMTAEKASAVYVHCLARVMRAQGVEIPAGLLPEERQTQKLINEVFK
jgi:hypothetical protein